MKNLCGEEKFTNTDIKDNIIANSMIAWFEILAVLVLSDILSLTL